MDWSAGGVELLTESREWEAVEGRPRRAGVSSFGVSGTNAHVILEEPGVGSEDAASDSFEPEPAERTLGSEFEAPAEPGVLPWVVSGAGEEALREQAGRLAEWVEDRGLRADDVSRSLAGARSGLSHRAVVVGSDHEELLRGVTALAQGDAVAGTVSGSVAELGRQLAFVFP
ncbi:ketoacyl-synthetase C-terminal extension domain-containing protein, partial [Nocardiopsis listeri]|uniref:ketoacyl-synthetase C-terminal extension domain-containing protein n=1 Tax=Nocardiopsis listeri TaxID=53440 RepID=UPI002739C1E8